MVITARFSSECPKCGNKINEGAKVEWEKGKKATHVTCPAGKSPVAKRAASAPEKPMPTDPIAAAAAFGRVALAGATLKGFYCSGLARGEEPRKCGAIRQIKGVYYVQVWASRRSYQSADELEDRDDFTSRPGGYYDWTGVAVEPTAAEAKERADNDAEKAARETLKRIASDLTRYGDAGPDVCRPAGSLDAPRPEGGREILIHRQPMGATHYLVVTDTCIWSHNPGSYDDYRSMEGISHDPDIIAQVIAAADLLKGRPC